MSRRLPFEHRYLVDPISGCWIWTGARSEQAYGYLTIDGKEVKAHRYSYELHKGPIPDGLDVLHSCDNPPCVNPDHLFLGTGLENLADASAKGRMARGERHYLAKLTEAQVRQVRELYAAGVTQKDLAVRFGTSRGNVGYIVRRERWAWLPDGPVPAPKPRPMFTEMS
jgi:hypothetical protein